MFLSQNFLKRGFSGSFIKLNFKQNECFSDKAEDFIIALENLLKQGNHFDFAFTIDLIPELAFILDRYNIKYVAWIWDTLNFTLFDEQCEAAKLPNVYIFCFEELHTRLYQKNGAAHCFYLPLAINKDYYPEELNREKIFNTLFVGTVRQERKPLIDACIEKTPNFCLVTNIGMIYAPFYTLKSRIVLNQHLSESISHTNLRTFEALISRCLLLSDENIALEGLFVKNKEYVSYKCIEEAIELINYYLQHDAARERIANAGYEKCRKYHTFDNRIDVITTKLKYNSRF